MTRETEADIDLRRRGGRPTKPAVPGKKKIKLSLVVPAETKNVLDAARESGRTQAEEAIRLINLGRLFEEHGRFTLPKELQHRAIEMLAADTSLGAIVNYLMSRDAPDEDARWYRYHELASALLTYRANHPIRQPADGVTLVTEEPPPGNAPAPGRGGEA
jgi:hypothetical protein